MTSEASGLIDTIYDALDGCEDAMRYHREHGTPSLQILTMYSPKLAANAAQLIAEEIRGKRVIEIGAGVGFLAIEMARIAKSVFAIEIDPAWSWAFTHSLYQYKPKNLTWIFGSAETVADWLNGDVVIIATRSGIEEMRALGYRMAPKVLMLGLDQITLDNAITESYFKSMEDEVVVRATAELLGRMAS